MAATSGRLPHGQGAPDSISIAVLRSLNIEEIFAELHEHMIDTSATDNHTFQLVKEVAKCYCKLNKIASSGKTNNTSRKWTFSEKGTK